MRSGGGKTYISSGLLLPSKVTHLVIKRPSHFFFRPGDYVFVQIPAIAKYEWHPFTLSSAAEQEGNSILHSTKNCIYLLHFFRTSDYMWLHIRGVGEWTNRLYTYFEREQERLHSGQVPASVPGCSMALPLKSETPQRDFLAKNLARISSNHPIANFQNHPSEHSSHLNGPPNGTSTAVHSEDEVNTHIVHPPLRPPRSGQSTSKLATDSFTVSRPPKYERQTSETAQTAIRKIQASLQRTFSRKGSTADGTSKGANNDGFVGDEMTVDLMQKGKRKLITKSKTPLEKSLSMPDIEIRNKNRERLLA